MKIAVINQKGGVGKTTTAVNFAAGLAYAGFRTLLVDLDPQSHATIGAGLDPRALNGDTVTEVLWEEDRSMKDAITDTEVENLKIAPATISMARLDSHLLSRDFREQRLHYALEDVVQDFDYILIDSQPTLGVLPINAIYTSDRFLIPVQASGYALMGLGDLLETLHRIKRKQTDWDYRVLQTMIQGQARVTIQRTREILEGLESKVLNTVIRRNEALNRSQTAEEPRNIFLYDKHSRGAADYKDLVSEITALWQK